MTTTNCNTMHNGVEEYYDDDNYVDPGEMIMDYDCGEKEYVNDEEFDTFIEQQERQYLIDNPGTNSELSVEWNMLSKDVNSWSDNGK